MWSPSWDRVVIVGVLRHGYGNWLNVGMDEELGLAPIISGEIEALDGPDGKEGKGGGDAMAVDDAGEPLRVDRKLKVSWLGS